MSAMVVTIPPLQARFLATGEENCEPRAACSRSVPLFRGAGSGCMSAMVEELPPLAVTPAHRGRISPRIRSCSPLWWKNFPCRGGKERRMVEGFTPGAPCQAWCGRGLPAKDRCGQWWKDFPSRYLPGLSMVEGFPPCAHSPRLPIVEGFPLVARVAAYWWKDFPPPWQAWAVAFVANG
jgi:hypothetical protein